MLYFRLILLAAVATAALMPRQAPGGPPDGFSIVQVSNNGNGCPGNSINISITPDQMIVLPPLTDFNVSIGPGIDPQERSKNCAIHASISYPSGWQFTLNQSTYSGYAQLDPGVTGYFYTQYFVSSNASNTFSTAAEIVGDAFSGDGANYTLDGNAINPTNLWSACNQSDIANFNNRLALESSDPSLAGFITGDGEASQNFSLLWQQC